MKQVLEDPIYQVARQRMVEEQLRRRGIRDEQVLSVMARVPRHEFVHPSYWSEAYNDHPVPLGFGATVSQPYMVATMLEELRVTAESNVLEIGTGTGYEAALLAEMGTKVVTIERVGELAARACENLSRLGVLNVEVVVGDGTLGYPSRAPYDRIIVAAAAPSIPEPLFQQLSDGGLLLVPVGLGETQILQRIQRIGHERRVESLDACRFVPLIGAQGHRPA